MKIKNATTTILLSTIFTISSFMLVAYAQHEHGTMEMHGAKHASDKARCAIDGMEMKKSAMVKMEHHGGVLYFCSKKQMEMFKNNPTKYLRVIPIGDVNVNINILTMKEHKDIMNTMGMGGMMKMSMKDTHYISAYLTDKKTGASIPAHSVDKNVKIQVVITSPDGKVQKPKMNFVDMMKYHSAGFNLAKSGSYKIKVILEAADVEYKV